MINQFREERDWNQFHTPENLAKSIAIEASELLECFQWDDEYELQEVKEELADIFIYGIIMAEELEVDIIEIIKEKMEINTAKYPIEKARGRSTKSTRL